MLQVLHKAWNNIPENDQTMNLIAKRKQFILVFPHDIKL